MGGGHYHVTLASMDEQCKVMDFGPVTLSQGTFSSYMLATLFLSYMLQDHHKVCIRIYGLPLELRG